MIYGWKEKLQGTYGEYVKPEEIPPIIEFLEAMNEWLYGDGQDSNRGTFVNKINEIKEKVNPIKKQFDKFEDIRNELGNLIGSLKYNFDLLNSLVPFFIILGKKIWTHFAWRTTRFFEPYWKDKNLD